MGVDCWTAIRAQQRINERFGPLEKLELYKDTITEDTQLVGDMKTLEDLGIHGTVINKPQGGSATAPAGVSFTLLQICIYLRIERILKKYIRLKPKRILSNPHVQL